MKISNSNLFLKFTNLKPRPHLPVDNVLITTYSLYVFLYCSSACSDAYVLLSDRDRETTNVYEILIGGEENTMTGIRSKVGVGTLMIMMEYMAVILTDKVLKEGTTNLNESAWLLETYR